MEIKVNHELCNGCQLCLKKCNYNAISIEDHKAVINSSCVFCNLCIESCPKKAIYLEINQTSLSDNHGDIWVFIEKNTKGLIEESSLEIISKMKVIYTKKDKKIVGVLLSKEITKYRSLWKSIFIPPKNFLVFCFKPAKRKSQTCFFFLPLNLAET
jgi:ferredoxin